MASAIKVSDVIQQFYRCQDNVAGHKHFPTKLKTANHIKCGDGH